MRIFFWISSIFLLLLQTAHAYGTNIQPNKISKDITYSVELIGTNNSSISGKTTDWKVKFWVPYDADIEVKFFNMADTNKQPPVSVPDYSNRLLHVKKSSKDLEFVNIQTVGEEKPIFGAVIISGAPNENSSTIKKQPQGSGDNSADSIPYSLLGEWQDTMNYASITVKRDGSAIYRVLKDGRQQTGKVKVLTPTQFDLPYEGLVRLKNNELYDKYGKILKYRKVN